MTTKQIRFLLCEAEEAFYGGAAGGGKSVALLAAALQFMEEPGHNAVIIRRTFAQLDMADSIMHKSRTWLANLKHKGKKARWQEAKKQWIFPNGNTLSFRHMDHANAVEDYQGGIWSTICVDEAGQFTEHMLSYPRTRMRKPESERHLIRWRAAGNPGGVGHEYLKGRYVKDKSGLPINDPNRRFFPATIDDNPHIDREDYKRRLLNSGVDPITLAQLLKGDWDAVAGGRYRRDWFRDWHWRGDYCVLHAPDGDRVFKPKESFRFLTVDPAASASEAADWSVVSAWCVSPQADLVWLGCDRFKADIPDIVPRIALSVKRHRPKVVGIEAVMNNRAVLQLAERWTDPPMVCVAMDPSGQDKLVHASPAIAFAASGRLYLPLPEAEPGFPRSDVESELVRFTGENKIKGKSVGNDDIVDTVSYAVEMLMDGSYVNQPGQLFKMTPLAV